MKIEKNISLKPYHTLHFDIKAQEFVEIENVEDLKKLFDQGGFKNTYYVLGGGANTLFTSDFEGTVVHVGIRGKEIVSRDDNKLVVRVGAGEDWPLFVNRCLEQGGAGIENLAHIPGSVGASPVQNIGAYGKEAMSLIDEVKYFDTQDGQIKTLKNSECKFGYRESIFKKELANRAIVVEVTFVLDIARTGYLCNCDYKDIQAYLENHDLKKEEVMPAMLANIITEIRDSKLPDHTKIGTAGSFFMNVSTSKDHFEALKKSYPNLLGFDQADGSVKLSTGQLIELAGFKGYRENNIGVYEKHALILVHFGEGKVEDFLQLAKTIQAKVHELFDIDIFPEVVYVQ